VTPDHQINYWLDKVYHMKYPIIYIHEFLNKYFGSAGCDEVIGEGNAQLFNIKNNLVNVHYDRLKTNDNNFWFGISQQIIKQVNFFIFICNEIDNFYVIPKNNMCEMLGGVRESNSNPNQIDFHINSEEHLIEKSGKTTCIYNYFQKTGYILGTRSKLRKGVRR